MEDQNFNPNTPEALKNKTFQNFNVIHKTPKLKNLKNPSKQPKVLEKKQKVATEEKVFDIMPYRSEDTLEFKTKPKDSKSIYIYITYLLINSQPVNDL